MSDLDSLKQKSLFLTEEEQNSLKKQKNFNNNFFDKIAFNDISVDFLLENDQNLQKF